MINDTLLEIYETQMKLLPRPFYDEKWDRLKN